jgi:hypothetical protein
MKGSNNASHNTPPRANLTTPPCPNTRANKANFVPLSSFEQQSKDNSSVASNETATSTRQYTKTSTRSNERSVSDESDFEILKVLTSYRRHLKFSQVCKEKPDIFGYTGTEKRRQVRNRREYLKKLESSKPIEFLALCNTRGILLGDSAATAKTVTDTSPVRPTRPSSSNQPPSVSIKPPSSNKHGSSIMSYPNHPIVAKGYGKLVVL